MTHRSSGDAKTQRFHLALFVVHPTLVPEEISKALGMETHHAHCVGTPRKTPKGTPLSGNYADTRWRHSVEHIVANQWFVPEVTRLVDRLEPHKAFFADIKSTGGTATIVIQFMDGFLADEIPCATLAKLADLNLSLGIECFAGL
ncbi:DUF4279 domain-containing protein [Bradyrhizobium genosp. A]|uniref:DUF4279 domain-containing protein n=1 Tax=Bradyrhizobium genosp. A TaxID=83626 RepID=UPI003CEB49F0